MKKIVFIALALSLCSFVKAQDVWKADKKSTISFFSHAPLEDIFAVSTKFSAAINTKTNTVAVFIDVSTLTFENKLQQEHFNEKYMESDKFPKATFKGELQGDVKWDAPGKYEMNAKGLLTIHGVEKERTIPVTITVADGSISAASKFNVKVAEHDIEVPELVFNKVAEEVEITIKANFIPYEKK